MFFYVQLVGNFAINFKMSLIDLYVVHSPANKNLLRFISLGNNNEMLLSFHYYYLLFPLNFKKKLCFHPNKESVTSYVLND